eukprot:UN22685
MSTGLYVLNLERQNWREMKKYNTTDLGEDGKNTTQNYRKIWRSWLRTH